MLEPCNTLTGNLSARGIHNSNCFIKCAFRLKKGAAVRELLLRKVWKVPFFRPKQPCGRCCTTAVRSILRFHTYNLDRIAQASCLLCARRENMLCFCIYWNRTKRKWRNCMFFGRPKTSMSLALRSLHFAYWGSRRLVREPVICAPVQPDRRASCRERVSSPV